MNNDFTIGYVDTKGNTCIRSLMQRVRLVLFAVFKRIIDVVFSFVGLIVLSPLLLIILIAIKIDSRGPALFKQKRTGRYGKDFTLYKFRSMVVDNDVHDFSKKDQYTKIGKFIRKTSLDEIPQLINIFIGDMSFVGPRPWIPDYYQNMNDIQRHRCDVRPGLTGLAQCNGRNTITIFDKINYDLEYIKNYSLKQDIKIIYLTIKIVLSKKGVDAGKSTIQNELDDLKHQPYEYNQNHKSKFNGGNNEK